MGDSSGASLDLERSTPYVVFPPIRCGKASGGDKEERQLHSERLDLENEDQKNTADQHPCDGWQVVSMISKQGVGVHAFRFFEVQSGDTAQVLSRSYDCIASAVFVVCGPRSF